MVGYGYWAQFLIPNPHIHILILLINSIIDLNKKDNYLPSFNIYKILTKSEFLLIL